MDAEWQSDLLLLQLQFVTWNVTEHFSFYFKKKKNPAKDHTFKAASITALQRSFGKIPKCISWFQSCSMDQGDRRLELCLIAKVSFWLH